MSESTPVVVDARSGEYAARVASHWAATDPAIRSFWQSRVVMREINRRITGDRDLAPLEYFARRFCAEPRERALSLGSGDGQLEIAAVEAGACEAIVGVDISPERVARAGARTPDALRGRVSFVVENLETYQPDERFDVIFANGILHHIDGLERWCELFTRLLNPGGVVYVDDFIGPARFQWTDRQLAVINRLLDVLPERLRTDLVTRDGLPRNAVRRPDVEQFVLADPSEAIRSDSIEATLGAHLRPLEVRNYGGALYHQFFNRLMGNFAEEEAAVRFVMETDFLLTDEGVLEPNYLWGVYRPRGV